MPIPSEIVALLAPDDAHFIDTLAHGHGHTQRALPDRDGNDHRVIKKNHHAISGETLKTFPVLKDKLAHFRVEFAQDPHHFFWFGGFSKSREVTQIQKNHSDFAPVTYERIISAASQDFLRKLRRKKISSTGTGFQVDSTAH